MNSIVIQSVNLFDFLLKTKIRLIIRFTIEDKYPNLIKKGNGFTIPIKHAKYPIKIKI